MVLTERKRGGVGCGRRLLPSPGYGAYQKVQTETSSPADLIALLYGAFQSDLQRAEAGLETGDYAMVNARLTRAQAIVLELLSSLDFSQGELPQQMSAIYVYIYQRLVHANVAKDIDAVREAASLIQPIAEAWTVAARSASGVQA
jgi:flagellar secretion chaperone FliS